MKERGNIEKRLSKYSQKEKCDILERLHADRREVQDKKVLVNHRYGNKKIYTLENREFYKITGLGRDYFITTEDCHNHASRPEVLTLYHRGFDGLTKTKALIKFRDDSDKIFISEDTLRVYFKASSLEEME